MRSSKTNNKKYNIFNNGEITEIKLNENPSYETIIQAVNELTDGHTYNKRLWNIGENKFSISTSEIKKLVAYVNHKFVDKNRVAFVTSDEESLATLRVYQAYREGRKDQVRTFHSLDEARAWLHSPL